MLNAASAVEVVLRYALREQSHCVLNDLMIKEGLESPFKMPHLGNYEEWRNGDDDRKGIHRFPPGP